jgi:hypothetical protein
MKCFITGHTTGVGKEIYNRLLSQGHDVIGISRSSGYDLLTNLDDVIKLVEGCDLFINNAYVGDCQFRLLNSLYNKVGKMIVMGSIAGDYHDLIKSEYSANKLSLAQRCKEISLLPGNTVLHLKISMLEDAVSGDTLISFAEVSNIIDFWIQNPKMSSIDLEFKLTPFTLEKIKEKFGATQEAIDYVLSNMCSEKRQNFND